MRKFASLRAPPKSLAMFACRASHCRIRSVSSLSFTCNASTPSAELVVQLSLSLCSWHASITVMARSMTRWFRVSRTSRVRDLSSDASALTVPPLMVLTFREDEARCFFARDVLVLCLRRLFVFDLPSAIVDECAFRPTETSRANLATGSKLSVELSRRGSVRITAPSCLSLPLVSGTVTIASAKIRAKVATLSAAAYRSRSFLQAKCSTTTRRGNWASAATLAKRQLFKPIALDKRTCKLEQHHALVAMSFRKDS